MSSVSMASQGMRLEMWAGKGADIFPRVLARE